MAKMTVDQAVCETLAAYGVEYVFGMRIYTDLDTSRTRPVNVHHEASAELMAYGYARISGKPGVCAINRPGTPNALLGLAEAYNSSVPIIVLLDGLPLAVEGKHALYAYDQVGLMRPLAKWIGEVSIPSQMPEMLRRAFRIATSGRPGPVVLIARGIAEKEIEDASISVEPQFTTFPSHTNPAGTRARPRGRATARGGGPPMHRGRGRRSYLGSVRGAARPGGAGRDSRCDDHLRERCVRRAPPTERWRGREHPGWPAGPRPGRRQDRTGV